MPTILIPHPSIPNPGIRALGKYRPYGHHKYALGEPSWTYPEHSGKLLDLKEGKERGLNYCLKILLENIKANTPLAIAAIPSSDATKVRSSVQQLVSRFAKDYGALDVFDLLKRTATIQKLANGGDRSMQVHLDSLIVQNVQRVGNRVVILIDDIVTSGNSLAAGHQLLTAAGVQNVICVAMGQTSYE